MSGPNQPGFTGSTTPTTSAQTAAAITLAQSSAVGSLPTLAVTAQQQSAPSVVGVLTNPQQSQNPMLNAAVGSQFQRLKVEDALSYLDQVKLQFGNQPQVYNDFLDIMKDFKSQTIDTPGVIKKVSELFKGHPDLIVGFNTFLPPGYKIEVQANETVNVYQPGQPPVQMIVSGGHVTETKPIAPPLPAAPTVAFSAPQAPTLPAAPAPTAPHIPTKPMAVLQPTPAHPAHPAVSHAPAPEPPKPHPSQALMRATGLAATPSHMTQTAAAAVAMGDPAGPGTGSQPVEFNHAINYVNKIKNRFQGQPEIYKQFLEILHTYQKEQRSAKEGGIVQPVKPLTETEVYTKVAKLFQNQTDLLNEFGQFLPDANGAAFGEAPLAQRDYTATVRKPPIQKSMVPAKTTATTVRKPTGPPPGQQPPPKKNKPPMLKDVSIAEASKWASLMDYEYFDRVSRAFRNHEAFENLLRCLYLFNVEIISRVELIQLVEPLYGRHENLYNQLKNMLGHKDSGMNSMMGPGMGMKPESQVSMRHLQQSQQHSDYIDLSTLKKLGHSYRALPDSVHQPRCTGRTELCNEVLNDKWVSFPVYTEGESNAIASRKTQYEEAVFRTEDERFELDQVIETNLCAIRALEGAQRRMQRMTGDEAARYKLDNTLGGTSDVLQRKAVQRIYGDKATEIIEGLKKNPCVAVPLVLRRLKLKDEEWREAQKNFNKLWREQNEKYYLKSLDHQCLTFKQSDVKLLRAKSLVNEIEAIYDERQDRAHEGGSPDPNPHLMLRYKHVSVIEDAASLIIHHVKRQTSLSKEDKSSIKQLVYQLLPRLFRVPEGELSEDEEDDDDDMDGDSAIEDENDENEDKKERKDKPRSRHTSGAGAKSTPKHGGYANRMNSILDDVESREERRADELQPPEPRQRQVMFANTSWFLLFRMHHTLVSRLERFYDIALDQALDERRTAAARRENTAIALRLMKPSEVSIEQHYPHSLQIMRALLDGNMEASNYEDMMRQMFGMQAYLSFTIDKLIANITRQLQNLISDEQSQKLLTLFENEPNSTTTLEDNEQIKLEACAGEAQYQRRASELSNSEDNFFKLELFSAPDVRLAVTLLDTDHEQPLQIQEVRRWNYYVEQHVAEYADIEPEYREAAEKHLLGRRSFLARNVRVVLEDFERKQREAKRSARASDIKLEPFVKQEPMEIDTQATEQPVEENCEALPEPVKTEGEVNQEPSAEFKHAAIASEFMLLDNEHRLLIPRQYKLKVIEQAPEKQPYVLFRHTARATNQVRKKSSMLRQRRFKSFLSDWLSDNNVNAEPIDHWLVNGPEGSGPENKVTVENVRGTEEEDDLPYKPSHTRYIYTPPEKPVADDPELAGTGSRHTSRSVSPAAST